MSGRVDHRLALGVAVTVRGHRVRGGRGRQGRRQRLGDEMDRGLVQVHVPGVQVGRGSSLTGSFSVSVHLRSGATLLLLLDLYLGLLGPRNGRLAAVEQTAVSLVDINLLAHGLLFVLGLVPVLALALVILLLRLVLLLLLAAVQAPEWFV